MRTPVSTDIVPDGSIFHIPLGGPYALTHSVGCLPKAAGQAAAGDLLCPWVEKGADAWPDWLACIDDFRIGLSQLFGGSPDEFCPQANLSSALAKVISSLGGIPGASARAMVASEDAFPSLGYVLQQHVRLGYEARLIPRARSPALFETWDDALTPDVRLALITHVHSNTGGVSPVRDIANLCADRGILCIVDVAQSAGILPFSFDDLGAPIIIGSCVKWLCGGPGAGFLWIHPSLIQHLEPTDVGWFSHARPFDMDIHSFEYAPDARRFWGGTPSIAPYVIAAASLQVIRSIGVKAIYDHNRHLMQIFRDHLPKPWQDRLPSGEIGGTLCIPTGSDFDRITRSLTAARVRFDSRKDVIRLSFHACNTPDDAITIAQAWAGA
jgi:kynureninase